MRPLAPVQLCRRRVLAPRTCLVFGIPSCCADAAHYGLSATPRFSAARRTDCETSSPPSTLLAAVHGSFRRARVLRGLSRPNMHQFYLSFHAPCQEMPTRQSGPLSQRIAEGCPRWATIASNTASLSGWQKLVSTSKAPAPGFAVIAEKRKPTLGRFRISGCAPHPAGDGALGYVKAQHAQFAMNARRTPDRVLRNHLEDQFADLFGNPFPAANSLSHFAKHGPIESESSPVPADHRFR